MPPESTDAPALTDGNEGGNTSTATDEFKPITSQEDLNRIITERVSRERSKFADYKDVKAKAARLDELEEANRSELEKANAKAAAAEAERDEAAARALRLQIATDHGISKDDLVLLTGTDEETLTTQAKRLNELAGDRKKTGNRVPKEGNPSQPGTDEMREFTRNLFGQGD